VHNPVVTLAGDIVSCGRLGVPENFSVTQSVGEVEQYKPAQRVQQNEFSEKDVRNRTGRALTVDEPVGRPTNSQSCRREWAAEANQPGVKHAERGPRDS
jgi:hypothetical protein